MANSKISALTALDKTTVAVADLIPVVDTSTATTKNIRYDELIQPQDTHFRISGGSDQTKKVQFEVDGLTTGTTRVITIPDATTTMVGTDIPQVMSQKTLTSPKVNVGADATGDTYYRDGSGNLTRLPIGSSGQIKQVSGAGIPEWAANPSASDASTTVKGVSEEATSAEVTSGASTGGTGAKLFVTPAALAASTPVFNGSGLTNLPGNKLNIITTDVTISNTATETNILSYSVAGGTLSTNNAIKVTIHIPSLVTGQATGTDSFAFRFKYGATTLTTMTVVPASGALGTYIGKVEFILVGAGTTSSQNGSYVINLGPQTLIPNGNLGRWHISDSLQGTSAIDSTTAQNLVITGQYANANVLNVFTASIIVVEVIR